MSTASPSPGDPLHLTTDPTRCVGAGHCVLTSPTTFDQTPAGTVTLLRRTVPESERHTIEEALSLCPSKAIRLVTSG